MILLKCEFTICVRSKKESGDMDTSSASIMRLVMIRLFISFLFASYSVARGSQCEIPSVEIGQTTTLTCHFDESVWRLEQKIIIVHYRSSSDESPETLLFTSNFNGKIEFYTHPDYVRLNSKERIQVQIPRVTKKHAGRYACLVMQTNSFEECTFLPFDSSLLEKVTNSDSNKTVYEHSTGGFHTTPTKYDFVELKKVMWILVGLVTLLGIFSITVIAFLVWCGRCSSKEMEKDPEYGSNNGSIPASDTEKEKETMIQKNV